MLKMNSLRDKFEANVELVPFTECHIWTGHIRNIYGQIYWKGKTHYAHRIAYELYNGTIPAKNVVMHKCDNPLCVNPVHLSIGTQKENILDKHTKGRANTCKGFNHYRTKFTDAQIKEIRNSLLTQSKLAKIYKVSQSCISNIKNNRSFKTIAALEGEE